MIKNNEMRSYLKKSDFIYRMLNIQRVLIFQIYQK